MNSFINLSLLHKLIIAIIILCIVCAGIGLFSNSGGVPYSTENQYGDVVKIYGKGLYKNDSYFKAPIFRGTDFTMLFVATPLLFISLLYNVKYQTLRSEFILTSIIGCFLYYATSIAFGVVYNYLHLIYIVFFSVSFFAFIVGILNLRYKKFKDSGRINLPLTGISIFLIVTGIALIVAWLPDIIGALLADRPLALLEVYTTEITYVLDMGIISPLAFICVYLLKRKHPFGYIVLSVLLTLCIIIGVMLPIQTWFQYQAGIELPAPVLITKVASFCTLAIFALYFHIKLMKQL